jgi:hypothetical protein
MTKILIFSPYQLWTCHTIYEETIAKACHVRGAAIEYLLCDGLLPECDQHWDSKSTSPRPFDLCQRCQTGAKASLNDLGFPHHWLSEFLVSTEQEALFEWAQSVRPSSLRDAKLHEAPLGQWVLASVVSYFRNFPPDLKNWHVANVYRGFLYSAAIVRAALSNYLDSNAVDAAILFNGRQSITRVALETFKARGIRVLTHERAEYQQGGINVRPDVHCMNLEPFRALWKRWERVPLTREALEVTLQWLIHRRYGANQAWIPFNKASGSTSSELKAARSHQTKRSWVLFTSSTDEIACDPLWQGPFESQVAWVRDVVRWVGSRNDVKLIIKVHPNLGGNSYIGKAGSELKVYEAMKSTLPSHVRIVFPEDSVNAYALADEADLGLTFGSTIGLEMAMLGKPVLLASRAVYEDASEIFTVRSRDSLGETLERCLHTRPNREIQRQAFRLAYYYIFKFELSFPAVKVIDLFQARANYESAQELIQGRDESLDQVCNFLMNGAPLFEQPTAAELGRKTHDEDTFFDELDRSPSYLRSHRLEHWLQLKSMGRSVTATIRRLPFGLGDAFLNAGRKRWHSVLKSMEGADLLGQRPPVGATKRRLERQ